MRVVIAGAGSVGRSIALRTLWVLALVAVAAGLATLRAVDAPALPQQSLAAALGVLLAIGLAVRSGGWLPLATALTLLVGVTAVLTQWSTLLAGAALATGVLAACLAVLGTRPAVTFRAVIGEVVLALLLAAVGGLGVAGWSVDLDTERFAYGVLAVAFVSTVALVYRLGGGLHILGRRGLLLAAGATVLLVVVLVYTAALTRYGSPELVSQVRSAQDWARDHLGGVPHPVEVLVGIPALVWGVSMRSRRRQGWWVCAFGSVATASGATRLIKEAVALDLVLAAAYSLVLGLLIGYAVLRLEWLLTGRPGHHDARAEGTVHRDEPGRLQPLH